MTVMNYEGFILCTRHISANEFGTMPHYENRKGNVKLMSELFIKTVFK